MLLNIIQCSVSCFILFLFCTSGSLGNDDIIIFPDAFETKILQPNVKPPKATPQLITTKAQEGKNRKTGDISKQKCLDFYKDKPLKHSKIPEEEIYNAEAMEYPHMAALGFGNESDVSWLCGGTLISRRYVITAAHCINTPKGLPKYVRVGDLNLKRTDDIAEPQDFRIIRIIIHPDYMVRMTYNDIALVELNRRVRITDYVRPACLQTNLNIPANTRWTALGWGQRSFDVPTDGHLHVKKSQEIEYSDCRDEYKTIGNLPNGINRNTHICAGNKKADTCQGNSGGPLQVNNVNMSGYTVIGVTSFGKPCFTYSPVIYTRVSYFIEWIESIVWPINCSGDDCIINPDKPKETLRIKQKVGEISEQKCKNVYEERIHPHLDDKIVGGHGYNADALEYPHMAALGYGNESNISWLCGGSLISDRFVLTAAHCIYSSVGPVKFIRLGDLNLYRHDEEAAPQNFTVSHRILHPDYKAPSVYNDIALIELDRPAELGDFVQPACLQTVRTIPMRTKWTAIGWGETSYGGPTADHLQVVDVHETESSLCRQGYNTTSKRRLANGVDAESHICAGDNNADTCRGDSGGPLQIHTDYTTGYIVIGITSFGKACVLTKQPSVYTRVSHYIGWIESIVWP